MWSALFFFMLFLLGVGSQVCTVCLFHISALGTYQKFKMYKSIKRFLI
jgi:hypothetical protein